MKKKIKKPFDIEAIRNGARAETNLGEEMEFVGECSNEEYPFVFCHNGDVDTYDLNGRFNHDIDNTDDDIVIVEEIEEPERWIDSDERVSGFYLDLDSIDETAAKPGYKYVFNTYEQAKSALAMAQISMIMAHDKRFGGVVTDKEWESDTWKHVIQRRYNDITFNSFMHTYNFLAFHTEEQANLFASENKQLVKDYLMID